MLFAEHGFITIDEFCAIAMISRTTFYKHMAKTPEAFPPTYQLIGTRMVFRLAEVEAWAAPRLTRFTPVRARASVRSQHQHRPTTRRPSP
jgi:predicted DNA-binding transcriptional regulator AlpA